jgi:hypothetical protein
MTFWHETFYGTFFKTIPNSMVFDFSEIWKLSYFVSWFVSYESVTFSAPLKIARPVSCNMVEKLTIQ